MSLPRWLRPLAARLTRTRPRRAEHRPRFRPRAEGLEDRSVPATFYVTDTGDNGGVNPAPFAGTGTLRQAIIDANANPGADTIAFALPDSMKTPGADWWTIQPQAVALPPLTDTVTLDGWTQGGAGYDGPPLVMLDGSQAGHTDGLHVQADNSLIRGLAVGNFDPAGSGSGVVLNRGLTTVQGCYLGLDPSGNTAAPNCFGLRSFGGETLIGGSGPGEGNVISGNTFLGIDAHFSGVFTGPWLTILGNFVGTNAAGTAAIPNAEVGIAAGGSYAGTTSVIAGNLVSGNLFDGIQLNNMGTVQIRGNLIGTDVTGMHPLGNHRFGIDGNTATANGGAATHLFIGDSQQTSPVPNPQSAYDRVLNVTGGDRNVVSANGNAGIFAQDSVVITVQGNYIGTDASGAVVFDAAGRPVLGNRGTGVRVGSSNGCLIGGPDPEDANVIAGNSNPESDDGGMFLGSGSSNVVQGNVIHDNYGAGVFIGFSSQGSGETVTQNAIYHNLAASAPTGPLGPGLGIDLLLDNSDHGGVTPNDSAGHSGPNHFQNFPVLASVSGTARGTSVTGTLTQAVTPNTPFRIEFFANTAADPSGYGEGQRYLGSVDVTTDQNGVAQITADATASALLALNPGEGYVTATATNLATGDTSEFSQAIVTPVALQPAFDSLSGPTITYGTASVTLSGHIAAGGVVPPGSVAVTLNGVTQPAAIDPGTGNFATTFPTSTLPVPGSPYLITYVYPGATGFGAVTDTTKTLTVTRANPILTVTGGSFVYDGQPHPATGSVTGVNGENLGTPAFIYSYTDDNGQVVTSTSPPVDPGYYTVTASFAGSANYNPASATATIMIYYDARTLTDLSRAFNAGRTIPIKIQLLDASGNNLSSAGIDLTAVRLERVNADGSVTQVSLQDAGGANPGDLFRYDAALGGYIFNLSTKGLGAGTYNFYWIADGDPTEHELSFRLV